MFTASCACDACRTVVSGISRRSARIAYCGLFALSLNLSWILREIHLSVWDNHCSLSTSFRFWIEVSMVTRTQLLYLICLETLETDSLGVKQKCRNWTRMSERNWSSGGKNLSACGALGTPCVHQPFLRPRLSGSFMHWVRPFLSMPSNYVLQLSSSNDSKSPVAFLYFIDSGGGTYPEVVSRSQADWVPEIIFWHIPSKAYEKVAPMFLFMSSCVGSINKESIAPQQAEMGIMKLLEGRPSVKWQAVFAGHNHGLDWCCPYKKLRLCYARHIGYGGYGNWPRGARILEITSQPFSLKSWIRMEDGNSHSEVILSS
ncbi:putative inactive purple acid phosphatase 16 [Camellia lanceoleosa]|uniref:Inactive purple acid phosphatase 16 n=1 Tax=Camellia lanceoleosa TaxID=1840588 RepID=A0ACC0HVT9_9ERIC|nr:putative inactive purple acid phosphatase 16 [Camellia lanceoleosa]